MPRRAVIAALAAVSLVAVAPLASAPEPAQAATASADLLAVSLVGDGTSSGNVSVPVDIVVLDGYGVEQSRVELPRAADGANRPFALGADREQAGALQQSADNAYVTLGGYDYAPDGTTNLNGSTAAAIPRIVARVGADGTVDTSTRLGPAFSGSHIRGVASPDGLTFYAGGNGGGATPASGLVRAELGDATSVAVTTGSNLDNSRIPVVSGGALYISSNSGGSTYRGVNRVDPATGAQTRIAARPAGAEDPHDFAFVGDLLYVAYTAGTGAPFLAKYALVGSAWTHVGSLPGAFWAVTGRVADGEAALFAVRGTAQGNELVRILDSGGASAVTAEVDVIATAPPGYAFRGVAFAPGFAPGTGPVDELDPVPSIAWDVRVAGGVGNALAAVVGGIANPVARGAVSDALADASELTLTAASGDQAIVPDSAIGIVLADDGAFSLSAIPVAAGVTTITVTAETPDGRTGTSVLAYRVAAALPAGATTGIGISDASAATDAGGGYLFVADDDSNAIRLFAPDGGEPVAEFDFGGQVVPTPVDVHDFEAVARVGDLVYWIGSLGNTRSGNVKPDRSIVLATRITGSGATAQLAFEGSTPALRGGLVAWDVANGHGLGADFFGFSAATQPGASAEGPNSLNLEGAAIAPDGTTLWLGFRSPLVGGVGGDALIVPVADVAGVVAGAAPVFGDPILLDLGGRAIRDLIRAGDGNYLIVAGSADDAGTFAAFGWSGDPADAPVPSAVPLGLPGWAGSYESAVGVTSLVDGTVVRFLLDSGTVDIYGDSTQAQDLAAWEHKQFPIQPVALDFGAVFQPKTVVPSATAVLAGESVELTIAGFAVGEPLEIWFASAPVPLATVVADGTGGAVVRVTVPADSVEGSHELRVIGASGRATARIVVTAPSTAVLTTTGAEPPLPLALVAALLVGLGALGIARRRRA